MSKERIRGWIERYGRLDEQALEDNTPLIERGILTSLQVMDLLLFLEEVRARPVSVEELKPGAFRDVNTIVKTFLEEQES